MAKAIWNNQVIAESNDTVVVEGNHYFPRTSLKDAYFKESTDTSVCGWKGTANYFHVDVDGNVNENAAWVYQTPKPEAKEIAGRVAFWRGVKVED